MTVVPIVVLPEGVTAAELSRADEAADHDLTNGVATEVCLPCLTCEQLAEQLAENKEKQTDAQLAEATYDPNKELPENYSRATPEELKELGLSDGEQSLLSIEGQPDFHAEAFIHTDPATGVKTAKIGFKGSSMSSASDWTTNARQAFGWDTDYYTRARKIGRELRLSGHQASFVGHSLGGGLAATAAGASGMPAQTFNAAGLSEETLSGLSLANPANVRATNVQGEALSAVQDSFSWLPNAFGIRDSISAVTSPMDAAIETLSSGQAFQAAQVAGRVGGVGAGAVAGAGTVAGAAGKQSVDLHGMEEVTKSLEKQEGDIKKQMEDKGCN